MSVSLDFSQSGSASTKISAQPGDLITFELNSTKSTTTSWETSSPRSTA